MEQDATSPATGGRRRLAPSRRIVTGAAAFAAVLLAADALDAPPAPAATAPDALAAVAIAFVLLGWLLRDRQRARTREAALQRRIREQEQHAYAACARERDLLRDAAERKEKLRLVAERLDDAVVLLDADGLVEFANPAAFDLLGPDVGSPGGAFAAEWLPADRDTRLAPGESPAARALRGQRVSNSAILLVTAARPDGVAVECRADPVRDEDGGVIGAAVVMRDVQRTRDLLRELSRRAAELQQANDVLALRNRDLDEFAHVASHELQEPLRRVVTFGELLAEDLGGELPHAAAGDLDHLVGAVRRMRMLVQDLERLSRMGRLRREPQDVPLARAVDDARESLAAEFAARGGVLAVCDLPTIRGDLPALRELFRNLLDNALRFTPAGVAPEISIHAEAKDGVVTVDVADNGAGVPEAYRERIFLPFQQIGADGTGTGAGLALCRQAVELHGGRIWVEGRPEGGSRFRFTLRAPAPAVVAPATSSADCQEPPRNATTALRC